MRLQQNEYSRNALYGNNIQPQTTVLQFSVEELSWWEEIVTLSFIFHFLEQKILILCTATSFQDDDLFACTLPLLLIIMLLGDFIANNGQAYCRW